MSFQLAHLRSQSMALVKELPVADDQSFFRGALLTEVNGEWAELESGIYGVSGDLRGIALTRYGTDGTDPYEGTPSFDITGGFGMNPGMMQAIVVEQGDREPFFSAQYLGYLPEETGGLYGVVRDTDGRWKVDFSGASPIVRLESLVWTQAPLNKGRVVVSFAAEGGVS